LKHTHENIFFDELSTHWRFTLGAVIVSAVLIIVLRETGIVKPFPGVEGLFETFFISHLFFAALTPASLLSKYRRAIWLGYDMHFHICIIEEPLISWIFIISGAVIGFILSRSVRKLSRYTHGLHIFLSSTAAGLYLVTYGVGFISVKAILFIPILLISVLIPCVLNDIGVPTYIVNINVPAGIKRNELLDEIHSEHHHHHH